MATASGTAEWMTLLMIEVLHGSFELRNARDLLKQRPPIYARDCKSLYDHLRYPSAPTSIDYRRTSIDVVIIRESLATTCGAIRWLPTDRMIADGLTKDKMDPVDLLRSCVRQGNIKSHLKKWFCSTKQKTTHLITDIQRTASVIISFAWKVIGNALANAECGGIVPGAFFL